MPPMFLFHRLEETQGILFDGEESPVGNMPTDTTASPVAMPEGKPVLAGTAPEDALEDALEDMLARNHIKRQAQRTFLHLQKGPQQGPSEHGGPLGQHPGKTSAEAADAFARIKWRDVPVVRRSPTEKATDNPSHSKTCPVISLKTSLVVSPPQLEEGHQDGKHNQSTRSV